MDHLLGIYALHAVMRFGNAAIVAEAVFAAEAAARAADGARQVGAAWQPEPDRTGADSFIVVANDCKRRRADASRHMHRPRIHAHHSAGPAAGTRQLNQVGAAAQIDQSAWVVLPAAFLRRHQRGNRAVAGPAVPPQDQL